MPITSNPASNALEHPASFVVTENVYSPTLLESVVTLPAWVHPTVPYIAEVRLQLTLVVLSRVRQLVKFVASPGQTYKYWFVGETCALTTLTSPLAETLSEWASPPLCSSNVVVSGSSSSHKHALVFGTFRTRWRECRNMCYDNVICEGVEACKGVKDIFLFVQYERVVERI